MLYSNDAAFFLSFEHLEAVAQQRRRMGNRAALFFFVAISLSFIILLKSSSLEINVATPIGTVHNLPISTNVLLFGLSVATAYYVTSVLGHMLLIKQASAVFEHAGLNTSDALSRSAHASARWAPEELWVDILNFRASGFRSGLMHSLLVLVSFVFATAIAISQITIILFAALAGLQQAKSGDALTYYFIALPSVIAIHFTIIGFLIAIIVPMKFRWEPVRAPAVPSTADPKQIQGGPDVPPAPLS